MPTYQYRCLDCTNELEVVQKFTDDALTDCPDCDGTLRKVYSAVGVVFKGSGFYATDNRAKGPDGKDRSGTDGKGGKGGKDPAKGSGDAGTKAAGESKPAASTGASSGGSAPGGSASSGSVTKGAAGGSSAA